MFHLKRPGCLAVVHVSEAVRSVSNSDELDSSQDPDRMFFLGADGHGLAVGEKIIEKDVFGIVRAFQRQPQRWVWGRTFVVGVWIHG